MKYQVFAAIAPVSSPPLLLPTAHALVDFVIAEVSLMPTAFVLSAATPAATENVVVVT